LCRAVECWRDERRSDCVDNVALAVRETLVVGRLVCGSDIAFYEVVRRKIAKNATRGHLHGKARSDG
jgi:hypothetical protein